MPPFQLARKFATCAASLHAVCAHRAVPGFPVRTMHSRRAVLGQAASKAHQSSGHQDAAAPGARGRKAVKQQRAQHMPHFESASDNNIRKANVYNGHPFAGSCGVNSGDAPVALMDLSLRLGEAMATAAVHWYPLVANRLRVINPKYTEVTLVKELKAYLLQIFGVAGLKGPFKLETRLNGEVIDETLVLKRRKEEPNNARIRFMLSDRIRHKAAGCVRKCLSLFVPPDGSVPVLVLELVTFDKVQEMWA